MTNNFQLAQNAIAFTILADGIPTSSFHLTKAHDPIY